jgi:HIRAN domain
VSIEEPVVLGCPKCGQTKEVTVWTTLNFRERVFDSRADARRFFVAGFPYHGGPALIDWLKVGDLLRLVREPENPHDGRAVAIYYDDDRIGYVPRSQNHEIADQLDRGKRLDCRITAINADEETYDVLEVEVAPARDVN